MDRKKQLYVRAIDEINKLRAKIYVSLSDEKKHSIAYVILEN